MDERERWLSDRYASIMRQPCVIFCQVHAMHPQEQSAFRRLMLAGKNCSVQMETINGRLFSGQLLDTRYQNAIPLVVGGPTVAVWTDQSDAVPDFLRHLHSCIRSHPHSARKILILGGKVEQSLLDSRQLLDLSKSLQSRDMLNAQLVGTLQTPASTLVQLLQSPSTNVARILDASFKRLNSAAEIKE